MNMEIYNTFKGYYHSLLYGYKSNEKSYLAYLRKKGIRVGKHTHFYSPWTIKIDIQRPWMIEIGDNVHITADCSILQHGYDWAVLQKLYGEVLGSCGKIRIGNNVFIGQRSLILKGAEIGDNVIIGAGSLVNRKILSNGVYAGTPARLLMSMDEYHEKRRKAQFEEARLLVKEYIKVYEVTPPKELLREYFWLFEPRDVPLCATFQKVHKLDDNDILSNKIFRNTQPMFNGYESFLNACEKY